MTLTFLITALVILSLVLLTFRLIEKKDLSILGSIIARFYFITVLLSIIYTNNFNHDSFIIGVVVVFLSDIVNGFVEQYMNKDAHEELYHYNRFLIQKFTAVLDGASTPFFVSDLDGNIEYVNISLAKLLGTNLEEIKGKNITTLFCINKEEVGEILLTGKKECIIQTNKGERQAVIIGNKTVNGHATITGSVLILGE